MPRSQDAELKVKAQAEQEAAPSGEREVFILIQVQFEGLFVMNMNKGLLLLPEGRD